MPRTNPRHTNESPIARRRLELGWTQTQLAERVGCTQKDVSRWEKGTRNPSGRTLLKLATVLDCRMEDLME